METELINRTQDIITGSDVSSTELYVFKNFPVNMLADEDSNPLDDKKLDMCIGINEKTGIIQLTKLLPNSDIYIDRHSNAVGGIWKKHRERVAEMIKKLSPKSVFEIGGSTGLLEYTYNNAKDTKPAKWVILEPQPNPLNTTAEYIQGFFPEDVPEDIEFDLLIHTHLMEHMYSPRKFMAEIDSIMNTGKKMVFSIPNLKRLLDECATSVLNFEHTIFLTEDYVEYLLQDFNYKVVEKDYFENHSIIYSVKKEEYEIQKRVDFACLYMQNKKLFNKYIEWHIYQMQLLNNFMELLTPNQVVFLWGGHITTQLYLAFGMRQDKIMCILDNDRFKWGKRVCGTSWNICTPELLKEYTSPVVILPSSPYSAEIKEQIYNELNPNTAIYEIGKEKAE